MKHTYVITGANRGIGLELARQLVQAGVNVIATARDPEGATALQELDLRVEALDVSDPHSIEAFRARLRDAPVDVLINNAGYGVKDVPLAALDVESLAVFFDINTLGPLRVTQALMPNLWSGELRRVVQMTSKMGSIDDNTSGGSYGYRASKAALNMVNRSLSLDLSRDGFTCVVLHPGWVQTDMGGASAPVGIEESAAGLLKVIRGLGSADNGAFYDFTGARVPW